MSRAPRKSRKATPLQNAILALLQSRCQEGHPVALTVELVLEIQNTIRTFAPEGPPQTVSSILDSLVGLGHVDKATPAADKDFWSKVSDGAVRAGVYWVLRASSPIPPPPGGVNEEQMSAA